MTKRTPLWIAASYGDCGDRLLAIQPNGEIKTGKFES